MDADSAITQIQENEVTLQSLDRQILIMEARIKSKTSVYSDLCAKSTAITEELRQAESTLGNLSDCQRANDITLQEMQAMRNHYDQHVVPHSKMQTQQIKQQQDVQRDSIIRAHEKDLNEWINTYEHTPEVKQLRTVEALLAQEKETLTQTEVKLTELRADKCKNLARFRAMENQFVVEMVQIAVADRDSSLEISRLNSETKSNQSKLDVVMQQQKEAEDLLKKLTTELDKLDRGSGLVFQLMEIEERNVMMDGGGLSKSSIDAPPENNEDSDEEQNANGIAQHQPHAIENPDLSEQPNVSENQTVQEEPTDSGEPELNQADDDDADIDAPAVELERELSSMSISFSTGQKRVHFEQLPEDDIPSQLEISVTQQPSGSMPDATSFNSGALFGSSSALTMASMDNTEYIEDEEYLDLSNVEQGTMMDLFNDSRELQPELSDFDARPSAPKRAKMSSQQAEPLSRTTTADHFTFDSFRLDTADGETSAGFFNFDDEHPVGMEGAGFELEDDGEGSDGDDMDDLF